MDNRIYRFYGIDVAIQMLRPGAKWEWTGGVGFTRWDDPRFAPTIKEVEETLEKIKAFEESINTIYLPEQIEHMTGHMDMIERATQGEPA